MFNTLSTGWEAHCVHCDGNRYCAQSLSCFHLNPHHRLPVCTVTAAVTVMVAVVVVGVLIQTRTANFSFHTDVCLLILKALIFDVYMWQHLWRAYISGALQCLSFRKHKEQVCRQFENCLSLSIVLKLSEGCEILQRGGTLCSTGLNAILTALCSSSQHLHEGFVFGSVSDPPLAVTDPRREEHTAHHASSSSFGSSQTNLCVGRSTCSIILNDGLRV